MADQQNMAAYNPLQGNFSTDTSTQTAGDLASASRQTSNNSSNPNGASLWNTAWNQGYNNYGNSSNPYSGQNVSGYDIGAGYTQGQAAYAADKAKSALGGAKVVTTAPSGGGQPSGGQPSGQSDPYAQVKNDINSGYNSYESQLDAMLNGSLPAEQSAQTDIINNNYAQSQANATLAQTQGNQALDTETSAATANQSKNLNDLSENMRNLFMAGNNYLGSRGAGDSSAANMYSYALNKIGTQQRGNIMTQTGDIMANINQRKTNLLNTVNNQMSQLETDKNNQLSQLSNWYYTQVQSLSQAKANGELNRGRDLASLGQQLLSQATTQMNNINIAAENKYAQLTAWATNNATTIGQLQSNLASIAAYNPNLPQYQQMNGTPTVDAQGNFTSNPSFVQANVNSSNNQKYDAYGNPITNSNG
jgi:hypothetical protein